MSSDLGIPFEPTPSGERPESSTATSRSLLERIKADDAAAWDRLVGLYAPLLGWWLILLPLTFSERVNPIFYIGGVAALFLIIAEVHKEGSRLGIPYRLYE